MKKMNSLKNAVTEGDYELARSLVDELYNDIRDFSQCIDVLYEKGSLVVRKNQLGRSDEYVYRCKEKIIDWVGGH